MNAQSSVSQWLRKFFNVESKVVHLDVTQISDSIGEIEKFTRAELRVHATTAKEATDPIASAVKKFHDLGMHNTQEHNGILLWINTYRKEFAIVGDEGINSKVEPDFWEKVKSEMADLFREGNPTLAILHGLERAGNRLKIEYPATGANNPNELDNSVSTD
ncbi:MAG: TPM domain-containing protein [Bacteroidota bacterium]